MRQAYAIGFPAACALAYAGGVACYLPLLSILLPLKVAQIAGEQRFGVLAVVLMSGAVAAGGAGIVFGWLSDRSHVRGGDRRRWIVAGLAATLASFAVVAAAHTPLGIAVAIVTFQIAVNAMLAPMMALFAEEVSAQQTGLATGLFAAGPPLASLLSLLLAASWLAAETTRLAVIGLAATTCLLPLLATGRRLPVTPPETGRPGQPRRDLAIAWVARLLVQVAGAVLFADLVYLLEEPGDAPGSGAVARIGTLIILANLAPLPVAVVCGRWSDRIARRKPFLLVTAGLAALGLAAMAGASEGTGRAAGFLLFATGWGSFLPLQVGYIMRLLPDPARRGRDLGIVNLANTVPVLIGQGLAWGLATPRHMGGLLLTLAALTAAGGLITLAARGSR